MSRPEPTDSIVLSLNVSEHHGWRHIVGKTGGRAVTFGARDLLAPGTGMLPAEHTHTTFGVFKSFSEARGSLSTAKEFDTPELADEYVNVRTQRVFPYDYPVMLWLASAFGSGCVRVLDIGGSVGVHFLSYQRIIRFPQALSWRVAEVPAMVAIGREIALQGGHDRLGFTDVIDVDAEQPDILLSAGAIQYIEHARPN